MRKAIALAMILALLSPVLAGCDSEKNMESAEDRNAVRIGAVLPLSGDVETFGQSSRNAIEMAAQEWNQKGGIKGKQIKVYFEDDENKPANSSRAIQALIEKKKVAGVIGSASSNCSIAMGTIATANKVPMIAPTATSPKVTVEGGDYVFRACFLDLFQGTALAKFAIGDLRAKRAAIFYDIGNDYSKGLAEFFQQGFEAMGGEIVAFESYNTGDRDFKAQILLLQETSPDVVLLADYYSTVGIIARQARGMGIKATFLGGDGWDSPDLLKEGDNSLDGSYFSNHYTVGENSAKGNAFKEKYIKNYNKQPDSFAALSYDAAYILFTAIEKAGSTDGARIKNELEKTDIEGVSGRITLDESRNPTKGAVIEQIVGKNTRFVTRVNP